MLSRLGLPGPTRPGILALALLAAASLASGPARTLAQDVPPAVAPRDLTRLDPHAVREIVDGRTLLVSFNGNPRRVELLGVQVADSDLNAARACLENLLHGECVCVDFHDGGGQKEAGYVFRAPDGLFVNLELIRQGFATVAPRPKFDYQDVFRAYEARAQKGGRGLWAPPKKPAAAAVVPTSQPSSAESHDTVYVTKGGKKYHLKDCRFARSATPVSLADAKARGYTPCSQCKPPP